MNVLDGSWYSSEQLAELLHVDPSTIRRWRTSHPPQGPAFVQVSDRVYNSDRRRGLVDWSARGSQPGRLMDDDVVVPLGISLSSDIEVRSDRATLFRACVRWVEPTIKKPLSANLG